MSTMNSFVNTYSKVKQSIDLFESGSTSAFISKRSENKSIFRDESFPRDFQQFDGKKIYWKKKWADGSVLEEDGIPFITVGDEDMECHYGPKSTDKKNSVTDNNQASHAGDHSCGNKKHRHLIQVTKKKDCPAAIKIKVVIKFPQYKVDGILSEWKKKQVSKDLKKGLNGGRLEKEARFYMFFPEVDDHLYHLNGPFAGYNQPTCEKIRKKINELAMLGVRKVADVKMFLESYVTKEMFPGLSVPRHNRRYFPADKDIRNQIYTTLRKSRFSAGDQQNLKSFVDATKIQRPTDLFFIRTNDDLDGTEEDSSGDEVRSAKGFLFVHQTEWQRRLLSLYGQELCLLDATYNTSKYDLPLFFLCVQTNVGYSICGTFITANESKDCIAEGLHILKDWNEDWNPSNFLTDFDEREISAVEETFQDCSVYLCLFHREQAWERWLKELKNGVSDQKSEIIAMLRKIANSSTYNDYTEHLEELRASDAWVNSIKLQSWLEKKWLPHYHRWVYAFRKKLVNVRLTTTNGLERKHQDLKKNYLAHYGDGTLTTLISVLINRFLQESYDNYISYNVKSLDTCRSYSQLIPKFLRNRPKMLVEHCMLRLPPNSTLIPEENITPTDQEHNFQVRSVDSDLTYTVCLDSNGPSCQCMDWGKNHLPCKHMLAIFTTLPDWTWESLPPHFRDCPHFSLDPLVLDMSYVSGTQPSDESNNSSNGEIFIAEEITVHQIEEQVHQQETSDVGRLVTVCSHLLKDIQTNIFRINDQNFLAAVVEDLKTIHSKTNTMIPTEENLPLRTPTKQPGNKLYRKDRCKLLLRKKRGKAGKKVKLSARKKFPMDTFIIDGTFEVNLEENSEETNKFQDAADLGTSVPCSEDTKPVTQHDKGIKRKGCLRDRAKSSKRNGNIAKKVTLLDPIEQVHRFETSINAENMAVDVIGYRINQQSFRDLDSMLPDEIMNAYISLKCREVKDRRVQFIACEVMTSIFTQRVNRNEAFPVHSFLSGIQIEEYEIMIGAVNEGGMHWTLMVIFPLRLELLYLNPLGETRQMKDRFLQHWLLFLGERYNRGFGDVPRESWSMLSARHRKQLDSNSCGVFVLKFAELILTGKEDNLIFDSSKKGLRTLRLELGQYLVENSDNMQEIAVTQEISEPVDEGLSNPNNQERANIPENSEGGEDDELDIDQEDEDVDDSLKESCKKMFFRFKDYLLEIINCEEKDCKQVTHQRHHAFLRSPNKHYTETKGLRGFGLDVLNQATQNGLALVIFEEMVMVSYDPKKPYSTRFVAGDGI